VTFTYLLIFLLLLTQLSVVAVMVSAQDDGYGDDGYGDDGYGDDGYGDDGYGDDGYGDDGYGDGYGDDGYGDGYGDDGYGDDGYGDEGLEFLDPFWMEPDFWLNDDFTDPNTFADVSFDDNWYQQFASQPIDAANTPGGRPVPQGAVTAVYDVLPGLELSEPSKQGEDGGNEPITLNPEVQAFHQKIWDLVQHMIPPEIIEKYVSKYEVFLDDFAGAYVYPDESNPGKWVLGVNFESAKDKEYITPTIVHEFFHILTLNAEQVDASVPPESCPIRVELYEGCANADSYIGAFFPTFWDAIYDQYLSMGIDDPTNQELVAQFYNMFPDQFVSDYAATNIAEDMAESGMLFVVKDPPSEDSIASQKILFFFNYPELVALRDYTRAKLGLPQ
jgi:hypothetical protein